MRTSEYERHGGRSEGPLHGMTIAWKTTRQMICPTELEKLPVVICRSIDHPHIDIFLQGGLGIPPEMGP